MTFRGVISEGQLLLEGGQMLPDVTLVDVSVRRVAKRNSAKKSDTLANLAKHAVRTNMADEHDHYASGSPKRRTVRKATSSKPGCGGNRISG